MVEHVLDEPKTCARYLSIEAHSLTYYVVEESKFVINRITQYITAVRMQHRVSPSLMRYVFMTVYGVLLLYLPLR